MVPKPKSFAELVGFNVSQILPGNSTHGTTVLALRCAEGVLMLADRRATMGNLVMYDHADKLMALDDHTVIAISGSFARAVGVTRFLKHAFQYYNRMYLNEMSLEGKLQEISRTVAGNVQAMEEGIGPFIPIVAAYDQRKDDCSIYFFDGAGARFENRAYACAGSGSERIRGVFEYVARTSAPWEERPAEQVLLDGLQMLDIASDLDTATGGFVKVLPTACLLTAKGIQQVEGEALSIPAQQVLARR